MDFGFGVINLGRHLPLANSSFNLAAADSVNISDRQHLVARVNVKNSDTEIRVTISFIDVVTALDGHIPPIGEFSLIVESPSGRLIRGNQHPNDVEEHFSTRQRVIVLPDEIEVGNWTIHVIANLVPGIFDDAVFAAVVRGSLENDKLTFVQTTQCVSCGHGTCDGSTGICMCGSDSLGQSCQIPIRTIAAESDPVSISIGPSGNEYISLLSPEGSAGDLNLQVFITDALSLQSYWRIHAFLSPGRPPSPFPRDADWPDWGLYNFTYTFAHDASSPGVDGILIHNPQSWTANYTVFLDFIPIPMTTSPEVSTGLKLPAILGIVFGSLVFVVIVAVVVFCVCLKNRNAGEGDKSQSAGSFHLA
jgi:hypothetical protein